MGALVLRHTYEAAMAGLVLFNCETAKCLLWVESCPCRSAPMDKLTVCEITIRASANRRDTYEVSFN